jgi:tetratricopeptide (TPR) repeat protein
MVEAIELKHRDPAEVSAELEPLLSPGSTVVIDKRTRVLIVRTPEREMPAVKAVIAKLDVEMGQTPQEPAAPKTTPVSDWSGKQLRLPGFGGPGVLDSSEVDALEAKLVQDPEDFSARRDLLAYYGFRDRAAKAKHVLWIIEHHPEFPGRGPDMSLDPIMEDSAYRQGKALWLQNVKTHPTSALILGNAAAYFLLHDRATAEDLLTKAQVLEPGNPGWSERLGQLYKLGATGQAGSSLAAKALAEFEKAQSQTSPPVPGSPRLADMAKMAVAAGELEKARTYANELLGPGLTWSGGGAAGDALYNGNTVLGRVALREGKMDEAKKCLLEAAKTKGSPVLDSFGPNMSLAKELLEKGETNSVLEFFQECERFWPSYGNEDKLSKWSVMVKAGKTPDFGANLNY